MALATVAEFMYVKDASPDVAGTLLGVSTLMIGLGPIIGLAVWPLHDEQTEVINMWNARHPDRQFVDHAGVDVP